MTKTIKVYFDYKSPYAFLAMPEILRMRDEVGVAIEWKPWVLPLTLAYGDMESRTELQWFKVRNLYRHARRLANEQGVRVLGPKKVFAGRVAAMAALYVLKHDAEKFLSFHLSVFTAFFKRELDIDDVTQVTAAIAAAAIDSSGFAEFIRSEGPARLAVIEEEAKKDEVFGVPSLVVDGELFWGNDTFRFVWQKLKQEGLA